MSDKTYRKIYEAVIDALQPAEEIGGPEGTDYVALMRKVATEAQRRIDVYLEASRESIPVYRDFPGFEVWQTGGGCTALGRRLDSHHYVLITRVDEPMRPVAAEAFAVGIYRNNDDDAVVDAHGEDYEIVDVIDFPAEATAADVEAFIESAK